ncbi:type VI secretion system baseplate subunit TssG [Robbsia andropogonis]|uniref:type VI secretion system baseplate subunit TssG n=1 Tax=Robbsia andropogonis TaxID=28092 RepID=UPI002A6AF713|nr:type VI secretion system baseplate subunit TssG [Robbsia andropogonis]
MSAPKRRISPGVVEQLLEAPHRFGFFQAVRVLERWFLRRAEQDLIAGRTARAAASPSLRDHPDGVAVRGGALQADIPPSGAAMVNVHDDRKEHENREMRRRALTAQMSFRTTLSLRFPPSEIEQLQAYDIDGNLLHDPASQRAAIATGRLDHVALTPAFFGLLGVQGALPLHYTEQIAERETLGRDRAAREYLNIFSNRATALFYGAWKKYRLALHYEVDRDERYKPYLLALGGVAPRMQRTLRDTVAAEDPLTPHFDEAVAGYAAAVRQRPMSAAYLQRVLGDYFGVAINVVQFVGKWYSVPPEQWTRLGMHNATLGATALSGERVWQRDMCARLVIGPMTLAQYRTFLRGRPSALALTRLLQLTVGVLFEFEVQLVLHKDAVRPGCLGSAGSLGQDAFMMSRPARDHRHDARYALQVIDHA